MSTKHRTTYMPPEYSRLDLMEQNGVPAEEAARPLDRVAIRGLVALLFIVVICWVPMVSLVVWAWMR
jgi:hypothetical protein